MITDRVVSILAFLGSVGWAISAPYSIAQTPPPASASAQLDAAAYYAFAENAVAKLKQAREEGGDPARFARDNPLAIHDAAGPSRSVATLAFVLASGADPNAPRRPGDVGGPILSVQSDPEKFKLLVKAGANINDVDSNRYTALSRILYSSFREFTVPASPTPGDAVRKYSKLELVRTLVDAGASIDDGPGSVGRGGMLALTTRADTDVIDFLISRGATLRHAQLDPLNPEKDIDSRGPLVTAIVLERDDLAAKLLERDRIISTDDRPVLLYAVRRGFFELAFSLLAAHADPSASDEDGNTPLMWARKGRNAKLVAAILKAGAPNVPALPKVSYRREGLSEFDMQTAVIIDDVAFMDSPRFLLDMYLPKRKGPAFILNGVDVNQVEQFSCEHASNFVIHAHSNAIDGIAVGICHSEAKRIQASLLRSQDPIKKLVASIGVPPITDAQAEKIGWTWKESKLKAGSRGVEFPVILVGHGIISLRTYVLFDKTDSNAVIVQMSVDHLCSDDRLRTPLCLNSGAALAEIAERVRVLPQ